MSSVGPPVRYSSRRSGWLALTTITVFVIAVLQASLFEDAFKSVAKLRVLLPDTGLSGLAVGSPVTILGTAAGQVVDIVIHPEKRFYAEIEIESAMKPFVRRDSEVFIRKQFGIAGAAYLEIIRGHEAELDWDFAVLQVTTEAGAGQSIDDLIGDVRARVEPILDNANRVIVALADLAERVGAPGGDVDRIVADLGEVSDRLASGQGSIGRLVADDTLARELEIAVSSVNAQMHQVEPILKDLKITSGEVAKISRTVSRKSKQLVENTTTATTALPTFLAQTQQTLAELETLLQQLQDHWLFRGSGGGPPPSEPTRLSPLEIRQ